MSNNQKSVKLYTKKEKKGKKIKKVVKKTKLSLKKGKELAKKNKKVKAIVKKTDSKEVISALSTMLQNANKSSISNDSFKSLIQYDKGKKKVVKPTSHDPDIYPKMYALAKEGYGIDAIALRLGAWPDTFKWWAKKFPEFGAAIKKCRAIAIDWWSEQGQKNIYNSKFNNVLWMMNMSNRFRWQTSNGNINKNLKKEVKYTEEQIQRTIQEVQIINGNTGEVARILAEAGALESETTETIDTTADEVHTSHASS